MFVKNNPLKFKYFNSTTNKNSTKEYHIFALKLLHYLNMIILDI